MPSRINAAADAAKSEGPAPRALQCKPIDRALNCATAAPSIGRIAAWYLYGAGALDSVSTAIEGGSSTPADMHKNAIAVARALAEIYDNFGSFVDAAGGSGDAFARGLADGLNWADEFYAKAFGSS